MKRDQYKNKSKSQGKEYVENPLDLSEKEVSDLLSKLCVDLGFCLAPAAQKRIMHSPPRNPHSFSEVVMTNEGLEPITNRALYEQVFACVLEAFDRAKINRSA